MPSFRVTATIGLLRPGVAPDRLLPAAADAARELATVEAYDVGIVAGRARITVRFQAETPRQAAQVHEHVCATAGALADIEDAALSRRYGGRWHPVRA